MHRCASATKVGFMALTKAKKAVQIDKLTHELEGASSAIVGTFAKLTVSQDFELRKVVRGAGGRYRVLKNKLAARASQGTKVEQALQGLKGVSSVAYTSGDPVALAKALSTWMQENAEFTFKLGIVDGQVITVEEVKRLATMPSKEEIFSKLLYLINAPAQRLVTVMNAAGRDLAVVINQGVEKGKFAGGAAPAKPEATPEEAPKAEPVAEVKQHRRQRPKRQSRQPSRRKPKQPEQWKIRKQQRRLPKRRLRAKAVALRVNLLITKVLFQWREKWRICSS
jgi:large subunit ribosomal protein L10